jgi:hypothetical protein
MLSSTAASNQNIDPLVLSESLFEKELRVVKEKLVCSEHPGDNQWCWVDPQIPNADHTPLCLHDLQLWVKYLVCMFYLFTYHLLSDIPTAYPTD